LNGFRKSFFIVFVLRTFGLSVSRLCKCFNLIPAPHLLCVFLVYEYQETLFGVKIISLTL
jgi:hypothetical protein